MKALICLLMFSNSYIASQSDWFKLNTGISSGISHAHFIDVFTGYASIRDTILKTTDGGASWSLSNPASMGFISDLYFINSMTGFAYSNGIYKTTNGGSSYYQVGTSLDYPDISFVSQTTGFAIGISILKTTNSGENWFNIPVPSGYDGHSLEGYFLDANTGVLACSKVQHPQNFTRIFRTTNSGSSWQQVYNSEAATFLSNFTQVGGSLYICVSNMLFRSINNGLTWSANPTPTYNTKHIGFLTEGSGFYCGDSLLYRTTNFGASWQRIIIDSVKFFNGIQFPTSSIGYLWADRGIYKTTNGGGVLNLNIYSNQVPRKFLLQQNYPNPFNPATKIKFDIANESHVKLTVYDINGKIITRLVDRDLVPARYEISFDGSGLASGMYLYRIEAGGFVDTKKLILLK